MQSMVEGAGHTHGPCPNAPSVGFAATSPVKNRGGLATGDRPLPQGEGDVLLAAATNPIAERTTTASTNSPKHA
jgi:hypothetical protein